MPKAKAILEMKESGFSREAIRHAVRSFQLPLACHLLKGDYPGDEVHSALYNLRTAELAEFPAKKERGQWGEIIAVCVEALRFILAEILNPAVPFTADGGDERVCAGCSFFYLCR